MRRTDWHPPVVLARVHLRVLHPELLGKQHEGVHWSLALRGRITAFGWAGALVSDWLLVTLSFCGVEREMWGLGSSCSLHV